jgi:sugar fermentation stimulation protein A
MRMLCRIALWMNELCFLCLVWNCEGLIGIMNSDAGVYIAVFYMSKDQRIQIGRLGKYCFCQGVYLYLGSAQRNLSARIERHNRKKKKLRWHIDYLSARTEMLGAITISGPRELECRLAKELRSMFEPSMPDFGASDCRCGGHLFFVKYLAKI